MNHTFAARSGTPRLRDPNIPAYTPRRENLENGDFNEIVGTNHNIIRPTQDAINPQKVAEYIKRLQAGEELAPVQVIEVPGKGIYIINGHHRYVASIQTGIPVEVQVMPGQGPVGMPDWTGVQWRDYISESQFWGE
ncbi:ParB/RepB/Spo0J family partition protein [Oscillospiraceae bacterium OttesenSCG-928-G22]|nr:ParB/RepB/Spo0J family partition protein [Oscillospiraceae bacterium OttesenSCG-928-G22]